MGRSNQFSLTNRKINPVRSPGWGALKPDGSQNDNDRVEIGPTRISFDAWAQAGLEIPNLKAMRTFRLQRLVNEIQKHDYAGLLLYDPLNIRYATDTSNMQLWTTHNPARACFVSADGYIVLWDFGKCAHLSAHLPLVKEVRDGAGFFYFTSGERVEEHATKFAAEVDELLCRHSGSNRRLAIDRIEPEGLKAIHGLGIKTFQGQEVTEIARSIKGPDDIRAMKCAMHSCELAMHKMQEALVPGISENELWAILHSENISHGGEWIETRLLASGPRTNPWFQECGPRVIEDGDMVAFDTDLIGVYGMCCDISRSWLCGTGKPSDEQKRLYQVAYQQIQDNLEIIRTGMGFIEFTEKANSLDKEFRPQCYSALAHGVGLCDEYPAIKYPQYIEDLGYDGIFEAGMMICIESYVGAVGGREGVKLEQQILMTENGYEDLTFFPFEKIFLD